MKTKILLLAILLSCFAFQFSNAQTNVSGNVYGHWTLAGSPYKATNHIIVPNDSTLTIDPGVTVEFQGHYKLFCNGRILAIGTVTDTITFTVRQDSIASGWWGIRFDGTPSTNDTSIFVYCKVEYGNANGQNLNDARGGGFLLSLFSKCIISNCKIANNRAFSGGGGICCDQSSPIIKNNLISNNEDILGGGIFCTSFSSPNISHNIIKQNSAWYGGGIVCYVYSSPNMVGNIIINNSAGIYGGGILCDEHCSPNITNNTISNNLAVDGDGFYCRNISNPTFSNCIIYGNRINVYLEDNASDPTFNYCDVEGGSGAFYTNGNPYTGAYTNNIDAYPLFVDTATQNYSLQSTSPCIDAGTPDTTGLNLPSTDIAGNPRIIGGRVDIGAYEFQNCSNVNFTQSPNICKGNTFTVGTHNYDSTGTYMDTIATGSCDSIITTHLTVNPNDTITIDTTINKGQSITIGTHTYDSTGTYRDTLMTINNCDSIIITNLTVLTGIKDHQQNNFSIKLSPNPAHENFTIELNSEIRNGEIKIFNVLGENLLTEKLLNKKQTINCKELPSGIYFYQIKNNQEIIGNGKLVIAHNY